jgi:drug/metabolite transporter (DMT)-like permease
MCDLTSSTLMFIALTMVAASVYQMMRGLIVLITALMSIMFLGRKLYRHHWTALTLIMVGIILVGLAAVFYGEDDEESFTKGQTILGIVFLLGAQIAHGVMYIVEEKLLSKFYLNPLKVVGWEGIWGFLVYCVLLVCF